MTEITEVFSAFKELEGCCLHEPQWRPIEVEKILTVVGDLLCNDADSLLIVSLKNGGYGLLAESSDYTGHGCRCGSMTARETTLYGLLIHLPEDELIRVIKSSRETENQE
jgi:hypothetical protein